MKGTIELREVIAETNGDKYWLRPFNAQESIDRCRELERRGTGFKVKAGLELHLAKLHISHGSWYAYLLKADIYPTTATRRMSTATEFMLWLDLLRPGEKMAEPRIRDTLEAIYSKPCILHDFAQSIKVDTDRFCKEMPRDKRDQAEVRLNPYKALGFNPYELANRFRRRWKDMTPIKQGEAFMSLHNAFLELKGLLHELIDENHELISKLRHLQAEAETAEQLSNSLSEIESEDLELELNKD